MLYSLEDPWEMASDREQSRFLQTTALLQSLQPRFASLLELGCGEGHQSIHLNSLTDKLYGLDLSDTAIKRACKRCPEGNFAAGKVESFDQVFDGLEFEIITACEVLYYAKSLDRILPALQEKTRYLFVSNFLPRSVKMRHQFVGPGWAQLDSISFEDTVWECFLWRRPDL